MGKCVFGVNLAILRFCDFYTGHFMKSKLFLFAQNIQIIRRILEFELWTV